VRNALSGFALVFFGNTKNGEAPMYRVYSGPAGSDTLSPLDKGRHLFKECASMDEAVGFAQHLKATGRVALLIEGDDGTHLDRSALAKTLHHHGSEQVHGTS
jgi:hypothetical protein